MITNTAPADDLGRRRSGARRSLGRKLRMAVAGAIAVGSMSALATPAHAAVSCISWIDTGGDRGQISCSATGTSRGYRRLEIFCHELGRQYWLTGGWKLMVPGTHYRDWLSCPVGGVYDTRIDSK